MDGNKALTASFAQVTSPPGGGNVETVLLGGKKWMKKNLNILTADSWCYGDGGEVYDYGSDSWKTITSSEVQANCNKYGRLYTWESAKTACPLAGSGWRLPTNADWDALVTAVGDYYNAGKVLKSMSGWNWNEYDNVSGNGTDAYGFSALPGGYRFTDGSFRNAGGYGGWWTATALGSGDAYLRLMHYVNVYVDEYGSDVGHGLSVRCVGD
jgi:uncharacterized protein (TIGR02145 family)